MLKVWKAWIYGTAPCLFAHTSEMKYFFWTVRRRSYTRQEVLASPDPIASDKLDETCSESCRKIKF